MAVRTIRQLPLYGSNDGPLTHIVSGTRSNGQDFFTACGLQLTSGTTWAEPEYDMLTCVRCLGTPKLCVQCRRPLANAKFPPDTPERCWDCW